MNDDHTAVPTLLTIATIVAIVVFVGLVAIGLPPAVAGAYVVAAAIVVAVVLIVLAVFRGARVHVSAADEDDGGTCYELGCGEPLAPVTGGVLYCPRGHCWVVRKRPGLVGIEVRRNRTLDCPLEHRHTFDCLDHPEASARG